MAVNLMTDKLSTLQSVFDSLEGKGFFAKSLRGDDPANLAAAIRWIHRARDWCQNEAEHARERGSDWNQALEQAMTMYPERFYLAGLNGKRKYVVDIRGNISFSVYHGPRADGEKAQGLGFDLS